MMIDKQQCIFFDYRYTKRKEMENINKRYVTANKHNYQILFCGGVVVLAGKRVSLISFSSFMHDHDVALLLYVVKRRFFFYILLLSLILLLFCGFFSSLSFQNYFPCPMISFSHSSTTR